MRNTCYLNSNYRVRTYHRNALDKETTLAIRRMWFTLQRYEVSLLASDATAAEVFKEEIARTKDKTFMGEKFEEYMKTIDWFYVVEHRYMPAAFMAVKNDELSSIWVAVTERNKKVGKYLVRNHMEIFNKPLAVQCYCKNEKALEFYTKNGFKVVNQIGIYVILSLDS